MARAEEDTLSLSLGAAAAPRRSARRRPHPILPPLPVPDVQAAQSASTRRGEGVEPSPFTMTSADNGAQSRPKRRRGSRGGKGRKKAPTAATTVEGRTAAAERETKPKGRGGSRGGRGRKKAGAAEATAPEPEAEAEAKTKPRARRR